MARYRLGVCYSKGRGVPQDRAEAARHWRQAADAGVPMAQADLANAFVHGVGVAKDYKSALLYARKADESGHPHGSLQLGALFANGWGVPADRRESAKWFARSAGMGDEQALGMLRSLAAGGDADAAAALRRLPQPR